MPEKNLTNLDRDLQKMAVDDWQQFMAVIGIDAIVKAKICLLRKSGFSYGQIMHKLSVTKSQIEVACNKCPPILQDKIN